MRQKLGHRAKGGAEDCALNSHVQKSSDDERWEREFSPPLNI
jgi:hypothetical protein